MRMIEEILSDINKAKSKVTSVELEIGHTTGVSSQIDRLIQAQNLLTYCHSRLCEAAPRWIPVTERLPENEQDVLVTVRRKHYCKPGEYTRFVVKAFYTDGKHDTEHSAYTWFDDMEYDEESDAYKIPEGWWESIEYGEEFQAVGDFVTHWMPLPQPPEDGGAEK